MNFRLLYWHIQVRSDPAMISVSFNRCRWLFGMAWPLFEAHDDWEYAGG